MTIYAEDVNYWKTSRATPDAWLDKTEHQIETLGGTVSLRAVGKNREGRAAFLFGFEFDGELYRIVWPVLETRREADSGAARVQAATMIYHYVKGVCLAALILGKRAAFFSHLMLPDGRTASEHAAPELLDALPGLFGGVKQLNAGEIIE